MSKMREGGVAIGAMKNGTLVLKMGTDYSVGEEDALVVDMIAHAKANKLAINAYIPDATEKRTSGGYAPAIIAKYAETREPTLMLSFKPGFPSPYLAFFDPEERPKTPARKKKPNPFARKS